MLVYSSYGSAQTILRAATLRQKLQIELSTSPSQSILTPVRPIPALTQAPSRVASGVPIFEVTGMTRPGKIPAQAGFEPRIFHSRGGRLNHQANELVCAEETTAKLACYNIPPSSQSSDSALLASNRTRGVYMEEGEGGGEGV